MDIESSIDNNCKICGNSINNKIHIATEMMYGMKDKFTYIECDECGCLQIEKTPSNLSNYYPTNYYSYQFKLDTKQKIKLLIKSFLIGQRLTSSGLYNKLFSAYQGYSFLDFICNNNYLQKNTKVLDVGCGTGALLLQLKYLGFKYLKGVDPFIEDNIDYKNGVTVDKKYLSEVTEKYDFIMSHHSFEHMENPESSLKDIYNILSTNGSVLIRIPLASSFAWQKYGVNWVQLDAPRHLYLHTIKSMTILAAKTGFEIVSTYFDSNEFQFLGSEQYLRDIPLSSKESYLSGKSKIFTQEQIKDYKIQALQLNEQRQGDQACFILKKFLNESC